MIAMKYGKKTKIALYWKIIFGMILGIIWGMISIKYDLKSINIDWIKPFGTIFFNLLKLMSMPLVIASIIIGVTSVNNATRLSKIGIKTVIIYFISTLSAIIVGLILVNFMKPGNYFPLEMMDDIIGSNFETQKLSKLLSDNSNRSPLSFIENIVPDNIFKALSSNNNMLQVIFYTIFLGISLVMMPKKESKILIDIFNSINESSLKIIHIIMSFAPIGVFSILSSIIVESAGNSIENAIKLLQGLGIYSITIILGLLLLMILVYPLFLKITDRNISVINFYSAIGDAQLLAFSSSSSIATLPIVMECCENKLNVSKEISRFVLPLGATINMDGTSLYQVIAIVFIAQIFGINLSLSQQLLIIFMVWIASIGTTGSPGSSIVMTMIVLNALGIPAEGISIVLAVDRILDMFRTVANVAGDAMVAVIINKLDRIEKKINYESFNCEEESKNYLNKDSITL